MPQIQPSGSKGSDGGVGGNEVGVFADQVHYVHNRIIAVGLGKLNYEIYADGVPVSLGDGEGLELTHRLVPLCLCPDAYVTGLHILTYISGHLQPPVIVRHELQRLPPACMSSHSGVMMLGYDPSAKLGVIRDVYLASEKQKPILLGPLSSMD